MSKYTSEDFDHFVRQLVSEWEFALGLKAEWLSFDGEQRAALTEDWSVNNVIQRRLAEYAREHGLTEEQEAQYARLKRIIAEHTPTLKEMGYRLLPPLEDQGRAVA